MGLLSVLGSWLAPRSPRRTAALGAAMARAVETVDPLLKSRSGLRAPPGAGRGGGLGHCERLAAAIPARSTSMPRPLPPIRWCTPCSPPPPTSAKCWAAAASCATSSPTPAHVRKRGIPCPAGHAPPREGRQRHGAGGRRAAPDVPQRLLVLRRPHPGRNRPPTRMRPAGACAWPPSTAWRAASPPAWRSCASSSSMPHRLAGRARAQRPHASGAWNWKRQREAIASLAPERLLDAYADWLAARNAGLSQAGRGPRRSHGRDP
jgi:hypothetical protein